jgi:uncharacterized protein
MDAGGPICSNRKMNRPRVRRRWSAWFALAAAIFSAEAEAASCVWKITSPSGGVLFLGGSVHHLRGSDYPIPPAYDRAFDQSRRLAFEVSLEDMAIFQERLLKAAMYPPGDDLRHHVDPRTYTFIFQNFKVIPAETLSRMRPWYLVYLLQRSRRPGVETYFLGRARVSGWKVEGLEGVEEHLEPFAGMNDDENEALLLLTIIGAKDPDRVARNEAMKAAWREGQADRLEQWSNYEFRQFPTYTRRMLTNRNRAWIPKIEAWIQSGQTYFVLAGAAHMGGSNGLLALLRARGYQIEQW